MPGRCSLSNWPRLCWAGEIMLLVGLCLAAVHINPVWMQQYTYLPEGHYAHHFVEAAAFWQAAVIPGCDLSCSPSASLFPHLSYSSILVTARRLAATWNSLVIAAFSSSQLPNQLNSRLVGLFHHLALASTLVVKQAACQFDCQPEHVCGAASELRQTMHSNKHARFSLQPPKLFTNSTGACPIMIIWGTKP